MYILLLTIPIVISSVGYLIHKKMIANSSNISALNSVIIQCVTGVFFGILACLLTSFGVRAGDEIISTCDAVILSSGLIFGGPSGIIAGIIAGIYRWFAVLWGASAFTRLDCSMACIIAGIYAFQGL